jgi:hypothetical protein
MSCVSISPGNILKAQGTIDYTLLVVSRNSPEKRDPEEWYRGPGPGPGPSVAWLRNL